MTAKNRVEILTEARQALGDIDNTEWNDARLQSFCADVVNLISRRMPYEQRTILGFNQDALSENTYELTISGLDGLQRILKVETPPEYKPRKYRNWEPAINSKIIVKLDSVPDASETTLTGTMDFTLASGTVAGTDTIFESEVVAGKYIRNNAGTAWYLVTAIASDTSLTISPVFAETTAAGATGVIRDKTGTAYVYWGMKHTLDDDSSTLDEKYDYLVVKGIVAKALLSEAMHSIRKANIGGKVAREILEVRSQAVREFEDELDELEPIDIAEWHSRG